MTSKNRVTINLSDDEYTALEELARRFKVSKAWVGRHAISCLLERTQDDHGQLPLPFPASDQKGTQ